MKFKRNFSHNPNRAYGGGGNFSRSRPQGSRPHGGGGRFNRTRNANLGEHIDVSRFINKAVITEQMEHFVPEHSFADFKIDERIKANVAAKGYITPTPIQDKTIPHILKGQDLVGIANTGTGKTGAFLLPLLDKVLHNNHSHVLVLVPTRELAIQIEQELRAFSAGLGIFSVCTVGGVPAGRQIATLRKYHCRFVIGTPGRVKDLVEQRIIDLSLFDTVVLDEADRMLDMGFINDMRTILADVAPERHTLFFSATLSREIEGLIGEFLREPVRISVKTADTAQGIEQDVVYIREGESKLNVLHDLLNKPEFSKVLVFGRTKHGVEKLSRILTEKGFRAESIHGNKTHNKRQSALGHFKEGRVKVLVATDVAARGLDIAGISHVINFDLPTTYADYVHRIGRTGRSNSRGTALTFVEKKGSR